MLLVWFPVCINCHNFLEKNFSSSEPFQGNSQAGIGGKRANPDDTIPSANQDEQFSWVDDYRCPLCGIELPPNFVEERQEHSDFHLAERLQEVETITSPRNSLMRHRYYFLVLLQF